MYCFTTEFEPFAVGFLSCESENLSKKAASGLLRAAEKMNITVDPDLGLVYAFQGMNCTLTFGGGITCNEDGLERLCEDYPESAADIRYIIDNMKGYATGPKVFDAFSQTELDLLHSGSLWGGTWTGHAVPEFAAIASHGTDFIRKKITAYSMKNTGSAEFYEAINTAMDSVDVLGARAGEIASRMLEDETDSARRAHLEKLRDTFTHAPKSPCLDFAEACIVYTMLFTFDGVDSPGHFDQYMYPLWKKTDAGLRREYLENIWNFFHNTRTWNLCISGSDENWNDISNDFTYEILDVTRKFKYQTPNLTMRCHRNTPERLLREAYKTIATGCGMPTLYNDEAVCPALENLGIPPKDAHLYVMNGCNQIDIQGKSHMGLEDGEVNIAKAVEFTLHNGVSEKTGQQLSIKTGDACSFETFDEFYAAFIKQLDYMTDVAAEMSNKSQRVLAEHFPSPLRSATIEGCIEKGREYKNGGPLYGHGQILAEGVADAIDSLAAVKKYVYEDKRFTMAELVDALKHDFEGYDEMYRTFKNSELRFGNDVDYVDSLGAEVIDHFNKHLLSIPTFRGGFFGGGCSPFTRAPSNGRATSALPNGKRRDEELFADSIGATPGADTHGPTALLKSCLSFDHTLPTSGFILNVKFDKELFNSAAGEEAFLGLYRSYFGNGGQQLSVTVVSPEELVDAQKNPDAHRDLIVRVGGYSDYFVNLPKDLQDNVIARTIYQI